MINTHKAFFIFAKLCLAIANLNKVSIADKMVENVIYLLSKTCYACRCDIYCWFNH